MPRLENSLCHHCTEREVGCHNKCPKYQEWNKKREVLRQKRFNSKLAPYRLNAKQPQV